MSAESLTAYASIVAMMVIAYVVLCQRINEGLVTKLGLLMVFFACAATVTRWSIGLDSYVGLHHTAAAVRVGIAVAVAGIIAKHLGRRRK